MKALFESGCGCGCDTNAESSGCAPAAEAPGAAVTQTKIMNIDLMVIDLSSCKRCVPTGDRLREAVRLLSPVGEALGIELHYREFVVQTPEEARQHALLSSPTVRINGHDIAQDIRESHCESCGDLTENNTAVDCREWHYRGKVYSAAPIALLVESILQAMLTIDEMPPLAPAALLDLPENLKRYFANKKSGSVRGCCS